MNSLINGKNIFDEFFGLDLNKSIMNSDVTETENGYEILINVPGFKKEDLNIQLEDGYLVVSGEIKNETNENKNRKYIRRERFYGAINRSFYLGTNYNEEDINATLEDGVLKIEFEKDVKKEETKKIINIK